MALQLTITDNRGITANYHRIINATQVYEQGNQGIYINLAGYVSKAYRDKEDLPTDDPNYIKSAVVANTPVFLLFSETTPALTRAALYNRIKAEISELKLSIDV